MFEEYPEVAEVDGLLADVDAEEAAYLEWTRERRGEFREAQEAHRAMVDKAIRDGKPPPDKPEPVVSEQDHARRVATFAGRRRMLQRQRQRAIASIGPAVEEAAREEWTRQLSEAGELVDALRAVAGQVAAAQRRVNECRNAQSAINRDYSKSAVEVLEPMKPMTPETLLHVVEHGSDPFAERRARRLGFQGGAVHGDVPESAWEPPIREIPAR